MSTQPPSKLSSQNLNPDQACPVDFILDEATEQTILNYDQTVKKKKRLVFIKLGCYIIEIGILVVIGYDFV